LKTFLLQRATKNEIVALSLYWFVKVEIKDTKILPTSTSNLALNSNASNSSNSTGAINTISSNTNMTSHSNENISNSNNANNSSGNTSSNNNNSSNSSSNNNPSNDSSKSNFQMFMDELLDSLRNVNFFVVQLFIIAINSVLFH